MADENKYNIKIETGTDFVLPFLWTDDNDNPVDLTGATVTAQLREHSGDPDAFDFICQHNNEGGRIWLVMPNEVTKEIPFSYGVYDVRVNLPSGVVKEPLYGDVKIQDEVTKPLDGTMLYMIGVSTYEDLPTVGILNRLYFCYDDRKIYRWNGMNYVATAIGNGIQRIDFVEHSSPFTDTYRITYDDGTTFDYQITAKGIESIELIASEGNYITGTIDTYRLWFNSGNYYDYQVKGGRVAFMVWDVDFDTGYLTVSDEMANLTWSITETTGMLSYTY